MPRDPSTEKDELIEGPAEKLPDVQVIDLRSARPCEIQFTVKEYVGTEVHSTGLIRTSEEVLALPRSEAEELVRSSLTRRLTDPEAIRPGLLLVVPSLMGGYVLAIVEPPSPDGSWGWLTASKKLGGFLEFDVDDRHAWTCSGTFNTEALVSLGLYNHD